MKSLFCLLGGPWDNQVDLSAGEHKFHVSLALGSDLPTSFKCLNGSIKYKIRVTVERSWRVNSRFELPFTIIRPLDLNESGKNYLRRPSKYETSKNFSLDFSSESLYLSAMILFIGYVPGQCIDVDVHVSNESKTHVKEVKVTLYKVITLISDGSKKKCKLFYEPEAKVSSNAPVPVSFKQNFKIKVEVPSLPPNIDSEIIKVNYELQIKAKTGGLSRSLRFVMPIVIGTFPLRDEDVMQPLPSYSSLRKKSKNLSCTDIYLLNLPLLVHISSSTIIRRSDPRRGIC